MPDDDCGDGIKDQPHQIKREKQKQVEARFILQILPGGTGPAFTDKGITIAVILRHGESHWNQPKHAQKTNNDPQPP